MSSMRLVALGLLLCLALLPTMLLNVARAHPDALGANVAAVSTGSSDEQKARAWDGAAKERPRKPADAPAPQAAAASVPLVEMYLTEKETAALGAAISAAQPEALILSFGPALEKTPAGKGIDPYVGVEAGKRRRAYARAAGDGRDLIGPVVVVSGSALQGPDKMTAEQAQKWVNAAAAETAAADVSVRASRATGKSSENSWRIEYEASAGKSGPGLPEDAMVNLLLVEAMSPDTGAPLRVVLFKSFKLPKSASGSTDIAAPAGSKPGAIVAVLQHGKTMRLLGVSRTELR